MTTVSPVATGVAIRRLSDGLLYLGTVDKKAQWGKARPAIFIRKDDAIRRATGLGGEEWGKDYALVPR